ncbi:MAG: DUF1501 domain-containing protein [Nitrospiraceae bacterium]|nr:DUF1501 domain-containing protein [Nitrospiraceae bacterium]
MLRRDLLKLAATLPLLLLAPRPFDLLAASSAPARGRWDRILILVELHGGNDGLNTLVPYSDERYYQARPHLAIPRERVLQLSPSVGFHYALEPLMSLWEKQQLAIVQGVGYPDPNRSHFRSIEIWDTASASQEVLDEGWLARFFESYPLPEIFATDGILLGQRDGGPLSGKTVRTIALHDPQQFLQQAGHVKVVEQSSANRALAHILQVQRELTHAAGDLAAHLQQAPPLQTTFPSSPIGHQLETAAQLLTAKVPVAVIKVSQTGFDTHAGQLGHHERLLKELAEGLVAFRQAMVQAGLWDRVLLMTYSEFGRRVGENASAGTDHGTAAPHLFLGGSVKGGLYGSMPSLNDLQEGDLKYRIDYRSLYATVMRSWWGIPETTIVGPEYQAINCLA